MNNNQHRRPYKEYKFSSMHGGTVIVILDYDKITIKRKGIMSFARHGLKGEKTLMLKQITAIQLKEAKITNGYLGIRLYNGENVKTFKIHRLVASTFIPNPLNLPQINHIDENKTNNNVENLEWCSAQYNIDYSQSKPVNQYSLDGIYIATYKSIKEASKQTGINQGDISCCCRGKYKTSGGFIWKYVN